MAYCFVQGYELIKGLHELKIIFIILAGMFLFNTFKFGDLEAWSWKGTDHC